MRQMTKNEYCIKVEIHWSLLFKKLRVILVNGQSRCFFFNKQSFTHTTFKAYKANSSKLDVIVRNIERDSNTCDFD